MARILTLLVVAALVGITLWVVDRGGRNAPQPPAASRTALGEVYDPVAAGEPLPEGFRQLLPRDGILPVYDPQFVPATEAGWADDTLVVGVAITGDARAYPVSHLNRREMVIDRIAGIPVLVTW